MQNKLRNLLSWIDPLDGGLAIARLLRTQDNTNLENRKQTSLSRVGFETAIAVLERRKTFRAFGRAVTVIGKYFIIIMALQLFVGLWPLLQFPDRIHCR
jgi:hypothetical protein